MKRVMSALVLLIAASSSAAACGSDDKTSSNDKNPGAAGQSAQGDGGTPSTGTGGEPSSGNVACDPGADGVCQNPKDCPFVVNGKARTTAGTCGLGCLNKADTCSRDCITSMLQMTPECANCYADTVNCTIKNCTGACFADPESEGCKQCQVEKGCRQAFDQCSGLPA